MFETIEEGLAVYRREYEKYLRWFVRLGGCGKASARGGKIDDFPEFDTPDFNQAIFWSGKIEGMEQVLGLSTKGVKTIRAAMKQEVSKS